MNLLPGFLVFGQTGLEECDILLDVEVVSSDRQQRFARMVYDEGVGGGVILRRFFVPWGGGLSGRVLSILCRSAASPSLLPGHSSYRRRRAIPRRIRWEQLLYRRVRPYPLFHFAAVHAAVAGEVDEERFVGFDGGLHSLSVVVVAVDAVGQARKSAYFLVLPEEVIVEVPV